MTPDRSHSDTVGRVANKVTVEGGFVPFNPYFYGPRYRSSDALPAPEIFLSIQKRGYHRTPAPIMFHKKSNLPRLLDWISNKKIDPFRGITLKIYATKPLQ